MGYSIIIINLKQNSTVLWNTKSLLPQPPSSPCPFPEVATVTSFFWSFQRQPIHRQAWVGRGESVCGWVQCGWVGGCSHICAQRQKKTNWLPSCASSRSGVCHVTKADLEWLQSFSPQGNSVPLLSSYKLVRRRHWLNAGSGPSGQSLCIRCQELGPSTALFWNTPDQFGVPVFPLSLSLASEIPNVHLRSLVF